MESRPRRDVGRFYVELTEKAEVILRTDLMGDPEQAEADLAEAALGFEKKPWVLQAEIEMGTPCFWLMREGLLAGRLRSEWTLNIIERVIPETPLAQDSQTVRRELERFVRDARELVREPYGWEFVCHRDLLKRKIDRFVSPRMRTATDCGFLALFDTVIDHLNEKKEDYAGDLGDFYEMIEKANIAILGSLGDRPGRWMLADAVQIVEADPGGTSVS